MRKHDDQMLTLGEIVELGHRELVLAAAAAEGEHEGRRAALCVEARDAAEAMAVVLLISRGVDHLTQQRLPRTQHCL